MTGQAPRCRERDIGERGDDSVSANRRPTPRRRAPSQDGPSAACRDPAGRRRPGRRLAGHGIAGHRHRLAQRRAGRWSSGSPGPRPTSATAPTCRRAQSRPGRATRSASSCTTSPIPTSPRSRPASSRWPTRRQLLVSLSSTFADARREREYVALMRAQRARAVVLIGSSTDDAAEPRGAAARDRGLPARGRPGRRAWASRCSASTRSSPRTQRAQRRLPIRWWPTATAASPYSAGPPDLLTARDRLDGFRAGLRVAGRRPR